VNKLARNGLYYTASDALFGGIPVILAPIIAYYLIPEEFALYSNIVILMSLFSIFIDFGSAGYYSVTYFDKSVSNNGTLYDSILLMLINTIVLFLIIFFFLDSIVELMKVSALHIYISLITAFFTSINLLYLTKIRFKEMVLTFVSIRLLQVFLHGTLALLFLIPLDYSWIGRYSAHFIPISLLFIWVVKNEIRFLKIDKLTFFTKRIFPLLAFGAALFPHAFSSWIKTGLDRVFLSNLTDLTANGIYSLAFQISMILALIGIGFNKAFSPEIFKSIENKNNQYVKKIFNKFLIYNLYSSVVIVLFFWIFGSKLLPEDYIKVSDIVIYLLIGQSVLNVYIVYSNLLFYYKFTGILSIISVFSACIHVLLLFYLVGRYHELGAAIAFLLSSIIQTLIVVTFARRRLNFK